MEKEKKKNNLMGMMQMIAKILRTAKGAAVMWMKVDNLIIERVNIHRIIRIMQVRNSIKMMKVMISAGIMVILIEWVDHMIQMNSWHSLIQNYLTLITGGNQNNQCKDKRRKIRNITLIPTAKSISLATVTMARVKSQIIRNNSTLCFWILREIIKRMG